LRLNKRTDIQTKKNHVLMGHMRMFSTLGVKSLFDATSNTKLVLLRRNAKGKVDPRRSPHFRATSQEEQKSIDRVVFLFVSSTLRTFWCLGDRAQ
jgi:hypothetical protein